MIMIPPLCPHLTLITSLKAPYTNIVILGVRSSTDEFKGRCNSFYNNYSPIRMAKIKSRVPNAGKDAVKLSLTHGCWEYNMVQPP